MSATTQEQTRRITVYRESPVWDRHARWFNVPIPDLEALWVEEYTIRGDWISETDVEHHADEVRRIHPGHVLVY